MNVWKSTDQAFNGVFSRAAMTALASRPGFFTGSAKSVQGSMVGTGSLTRGVEIKPSAELIGYADLDAVVDQHADGVIQDILLTQEVLPGDSIFLTPRVNAITVEHDEQGWRDEKSAAFSCSFNSYMI